MKLLVIEDEPRMGELLVRGLGEEGHRVDLCTTAAEARRRVELVEYEVIVLDWGLPDGDGVNLLQGWRAAGLATPVLMLTARGSSGEKVLGLRTGADDYLVKPFDFDELVARLEALHRRHQGGTLDAVQLGDLQFFRRSRLLTRGAVQVELTAREYQLLSALLEHLGDAVTRAELLARVWGPDFDGEPNVLEVYIGYLRSKIEQLATEQVRISTVRGVGYRLHTPRSAS
ncbi:MAG: response regulator transcription factor [Polyangiaceae bacterium]|jgi:DNA-binding response OmpR family regulator|nr:response regulator transcription factor [Polyangiaceae bacterium]